MMKIRSFYNNLRYGFRPKKPVLILKLGWIFSKAFLTGRIYPRYADFAVDFQCNLNCQHCFAKALADHKKKELTLDEYKDVIRQCLNMGVVNFSFQGGEPLLFIDKILELISFCQPYKSVISVTTNGTLLNEKNVKRLKKAGVDILTVSIDSLDSKEHDVFRDHEGTLQKVLEGVKLACKEGLKVTIGTVVSHLNLRSEGLKQVFAYSTQMRLNCCLALAVPTGNWKNNTDILLTEEDESDLIRLIAQFPYVRTDMEANWIRWGCGAMKEILYFTPYGDVFCCPFIHISFGHIREKNIQEIRENALEKYWFLKHYHPKCLCATDRWFMEKYLLNLKDFTPYPPSDNIVFTNEL